jgi:hypothetical protein
MTAPALLLEVAPRRARSDLLPTLALQDARPVGRPRGQHGEVAQALLDAMAELVTPERAPTLLELAHAAQVGRLSAERTLGNLVRCGTVSIVRRRWVTYRSSPVAEYAPAAGRGAGLDDGPQRLAQAMQAMGR